MPEISSNYNSVSPFTAQVGEKAPDFTLRTTRNEEWRLSDCLGRVVTLLFYPKDETLVCTRQMCSLRDNWKDYVKTRSMVVGVSPGTIEEHLAFSENHNLPIPLLADNEGIITKTYAHHWFFPSVLLRSVVVVDAGGFVRTRQTMLRAFRPTDQDIITEILRARADAVGEEYELLKNKMRRET